LQVVAFSTPSCPEWRWRLVNYAGDVVEESSQTFASIASAITVGTLRMNDLDADDTRRTPTYFRSTSHLRSR
jgi:hypothetical protein